MAKRAVATLAVSVVAKTKGFLKKLRSLRKRIKQFATSVGRTMVTAGAAFSAFGVVAVTAIALVVRSQLKLVDSLAKTASKLSVTTEKLASFQVAAELAGV